MSEPPAGGAIALDDLTLAYGGRPVVLGLSGAFEVGSLTAIVGPNGAGKSSLLAAIMGRLRPASGAVRMAAGLRGRIAWLPQAPEIDRQFPIRVFDLVALGLWRRCGSYGGVGVAQRAEVEHALAAVGLHGFERRGIAELSAGQFQRALFARVLLQDAALIILDEPFNAIDTRTTDDLLALVARWHAQGRTVIAVLHDLDLVRAHFERTLLLARRCIAWGPTAEVLQPERLAQARKMTAAWDEAARPFAQAA